MEHYLPSCTRSLIMYLKTTDCGAKKQPTSPKACSMFKPSQQKACCRKLNSQIPRAAASQARFSTWQSK